jgi:hypothetical protein
MRCVAIKSIRIRLDALDLNDNKNETYKRTEPAVSSGVPPQHREIWVYDSGSWIVVTGRPPGKPRATFLPSILIVASVSLDAVNL